MNWGKYEKSITRLNAEQLAFLRKVSKEEKQREVETLKAIYLSPSGISIYHAFEISKGDIYKFEYLLSSIMEDSNWVLFEEREELLYELKKREI